MVIMKIEQKNIRMQKTGFTGFITPRSSSNEPSFNTTRTSMQRSAAEKLNLKFTLKETDYKGSSQRERIETNKLRMPKIRHNGELLLSSPMGRPSMQRKLPVHRYSYGPSFEASHRK